MSKNQDKRASLDNFQILILIIFILILIIVGYRASNSKSIDYKFAPNNTQVEVVGSSGQIPSNTSVQDSKTSTGQQLGPATVQDLGGNSGATNIDELLKDKQIDVGK